MTPEANPSAPTPAATTKFDLKEIRSLATSRTYAAVSAAPAPEAAAAPVTVEAARKKRQVVVPTTQFFRDLAYNSVNLNKDGQPDKAVYTSPFAYPSFYPYIFPCTTVKIITTVALIWLIDLMITKYIHKYYDFTTSQRSF